MSSQNEPNISEEVKKMEYEPLLPVEKKLIAWSLLLEVGLIGVLYGASQFFFPEGH